jgi:hypothetical protein
MQFVNLFQVSPDHRRIPEPNLIDEIYRPKTFVKYHNDGNPNEKHFTRELAVSGGTVSNFVRDEKNQKLALEDAIFWPKSAIETKCVGAYVVAAAVGFFLMPMLLPAIGAGESIAAAYGSGAVTYYMIHANDLHVKLN